MENNENNDILYICRAKRCQGNGSAEIVGLLEKVLKTKLDKAVDEDLIKLQTSLCMGHCAKGPNIKTNDNVFNQVDRATLKRVLVGMKSRLSK